VSFGCTHMWPLDQIRDLIWRLTRPQMPSLVVDEQGFSLCKAAQVTERYSWGEVGRIIAFKRDLGTYDEICMQIDIGRRACPLELSEEFGGYEQFAKAVEKHLPGVNREWWSQVAFPAFAENVTTIYQRVPDGTAP
jgi:hypothetical protein